MCKFESCPGHDIKTADAVFVLYANTVTGIILDMALKYIFPDPGKADAEGLVAAGGDLSVEALLTAYSKGIFPWFDETSPILWWSPDPRMVLFPSRLKVSDSLKRKIKSNLYNIQIDRNFRDVITQCAAVRRKGQKGT